MSHTILCRDLHLDRQVLVKSLQAGTETRRILDELGALQTIRSKHVVQIYDVVKDKSGEILAIVEEYLPGDDLTAASPATSMEEFFKLTYPIAEGIADIHRHGRVHRDIKLHNMKYDSEGCLKIFDFGLARAEEVDASTMAQIGTPGYMAPELFRAGRIKFTTAVDTFAFGSTALTLAIGKLPRELRKLPPILSPRRTDFSDLGIKLPQEIGELLDRCFEHDAAKRPQMSEIAKQLALHLLKDRHRALLVSNGKTYTLSKDNRAVRLSAKDQGSVEIAYDGLRLLVRSVSGDVEINNMNLSPGDELPGSCVIVLGAPELKGQRTNITVDISHPEVLL